MIGLANIIPGCPDLIRLALIIPNHFQVMIGLAPNIPGGPVLIRLALISPDLFQD